MRQEGRHDLRDIASRLRRGVSPHTTPAMHRDCRTACATSCAWFLSTRVGGIRPFSNGPSTPIAPCICMYKPTGTRTLTLTFISNPDLNPRPWPSRCPCAPVARGADHGPAATGPSRADVRTASGSCRRGIAAQQTVCLAGRGRPAPGPRTLQSPKLKLRPALRIGKKED